MRISNESHLDWSPLYRRAVAARRNGAAFFQRLRKIIGMQVAGRGDNGSRTPWSTQGNRVNQFDRAMTRGAFALTIYNDLKLGYRGPPSLSMSPPKRR
jgi:hypothetical protein